MSIEQLKAEENSLRDQIGLLPREARKHYYQLEAESIRDPDTYAVLNYFFVCGLHHFYLGKTVRGLLNLLVMLVGLLLWEFYGFVLVILVIVVELPQLFRSQTIVYRHNIKVMRNTLDKVQRGC